MISAAIKRLSPNGHWKFPEEMSVGGYTGFVYAIRDNIMERFYLGKKFYFSQKRGTKPAASNWKTYMTSSGTMADVFKHRPKDEFDFICLEQYKKRGAVSYAETWSLCHVEAPTSFTWFNQRIEKVSWPVSEPITDRHKERLKRVIAMAPFDE
jgi:hypothetical protein